MHSRALLFVVCLFGNSAYAQVFEPTWESLEQYSAPEWFRDAKFGIMLHWGPQSVPGVNGALDGWYARNLYIQQGAPWGNAYEHHTTHFGHPSVVGYKDVIPEWRAENWDPVALVQFFREVGARYIVPVAVHHDNFDVFNSTWQPWNSVNMGPRRDVVGEWAAAARAQGLRFGVTTHNATSWWWFQTSRGSDGFGPQAGVPYDGRLRAADGVGTWWEGYDPQDLYGPPAHPDGGANAGFVENWHRRTFELMDRYEPDLFYFDGDVPFGNLELISYYYNQSQVWNEGRLDGVLNLKVVPPEISRHSFVLDFEKGQSATLRPYPWQTDTPFTEHYFYTHNHVIRGVLYLHILCDTVSKNGNMLLNVALFPDGTIPADQEEQLRIMGDWLDVNGEAIFDTRPWVTYGEGPTVIGDGPFSLNYELMTPEDVRFTTRGDTLYAIFFGRPETGSTVIEALAPGVHIQSIQSVEMLGYADAIPWEHTPTGLRVTVPPGAPDATAYALRIMATHIGTPGTPSPPEPSEPALAVRHYPNPSSGTSKLFVRVNSRELVTARIFDLQGRLIREQEVRAEAGAELELIVDMTGVAAGMYICHVTAGRHSEVLRFVHRGDG